MRVIAGSCRGIRLKAPPGKNTRPTSDRVKESLFNIISNMVDFNGCNVVDICAGTGSLGIEALSRGADFCTFIENDRSVLDVLRQNLDSTGFTQKSSVMAMESLLALKVLSGRGCKYQLFLLDPPYASGIYQPVIEQLSVLANLSDNPLVVAECSSRAVLQDKIGRFIKIDRRVYGDTALEIYSMEGA
jgi:16S rRNA (guanine966-N2)-methyltransferase